MRKTRKLALVVAVVIAIAFVTPWLMGRVVKSRVNDMLVSINNYVASTGVKVILKDYHRGWFSSTAQVLVEAGPFTQGIDVPLTRNTIEIWHGPLVFNKHKKLFTYALADIEGKIGFSDYINAVFLLLNTQVPTVSAYGVIGFDDSFSGAFDLSSTNFSSKGLHIDWGGVFGEYAISFSGDALKLNVQTEPLALTYGEEEHHLGKMLMALNAEKTSVRYLTDSIFRFRLPGARFTEAGSTLLALQQGEIDASAKLTNNLYAMHLLASADALEINESRYAPVGLKLSLDNLNAASMSELFELYMSKEYANTMLGVEHLFPLISNGTRVSLDYLTLGLPRGLAQLQASLAWPTKPASASIVDIVSAMHSLLKFNLPIVLVQHFIDEEVDGMTPEALATKEGVAALERKKKNEDQIKGWVKQGYIIEKNGFYETSLTGVGDVYKINGIEIKGVSSLIEPPKVES